MNLQNEILSILKSVVDDEKAEVSVSFSNRPDLCDFQSNFCFALAKKMQKTPCDLASEIVEKIPENQKFLFEAVLSISIPMRFAS